MSGFNLTDKLQNPVKVNSKVVFSPSTRYGGLKLAVVTSMEMKTRPERKKNERSPLNRTWKPKVGHIDTGDIRAWIEIKIKPIDGRTLTRHSGSVVLNDQCPDFNTLDLLVIDKVLV